MSAEAKIRELISRIVHRDTAELRRLLNELSARLAALEDSGAPAVPAEEKKPAAGRTAKARAQSADVSATVPQQRTEARP